MFGSQDSLVALEKSLHTLEFLGTFFEGGGNPMKWTFH
jgi:hypothetical protein